VKAFLIEVETQLCAVTHWITRTHFPLFTLPPKGIAGGNIFNLTHYIYVVLLGRNGIKERLPRFVYGYARRNESNEGKGEQIEGL